MEGPFADPVRGTLPEASPGPFGTRSAALGSLLGPSSVLSGCSGVALGRSWGALGAALVNNSALTDQNSIKDLKRP